MEAKEEDDIVTCLVVLTVRVSLVEDFSRVAVPPFRCSKSGVTAAATFAFPIHHFPSTQFSEIITGFCGANRARFFFSFSHFTLTAFKSYALLIPNCYVMDQIAILAAIRVDAP